jgi:hypothetical protein
MPNVTAPVSSYQHLCAFGVHFLLFRSLEHVASNKRAAVVSPSLCPHVIVCVHKC